MAKEFVKQTAPNWLVVMLMGICVFYIKRNVEQMDAVADQARANQTAVVVLDKQADKMTEAIGTIDQICRQLETRLVRLETRENNRNQP